MKSPCRSFLHYCFLSHSTSSYYLCFRPDSNFECGDDQRRFVVVFQLVADAWWLHAHESSKVLSSSFYFLSSIRRQLLGIYIPISEGKSCDEAELNWYTTFGAPHCRTLGWIWQFQFARHFSRSINSLFVASLQIIASQISDFLRYLPSWDSNL